MKNYLLKTLCFTLLVSLSSYATNIPISLNPQQLEKKLKPEIEPGNIEKSVITQQQQFDPTLPIDFYQKTILIKRINLDGNTIFLDQTFAKYYNHLLGKEISLATLYEIAEKITNHYRKEGYVLASAFIPAQELRNGLIKIKIVEGYISKINLEGDFDQNKIIDRTVEKIYNIKPFNIKQFERYMLLLNELPGVAAKAVLKKHSNKDQTLGGVDLDILLSKESKKIGLGWHNNISRYLGNFLAQMSYEHPNLIFNNNIINVGVSVSDEFSNIKLLTVSDKITLNSEGSNLYIEGTKIKIKPGHNLNINKVKIDSESINLNLSHPLIRSRVENLSIYSGLSINYTRTEAAEFLTNKDRLRILTIGSNYDFFDTYKGANLINISGSRGLKILNSTKNDSEFLSKENGKINFSKANLRFARMQNIIDNLNLYFSINSQHTKDILLSSEIFSIGGANIGKGYDPSALTGDNGYTFTTELRYKLSPIGIMDSEAFCFYDYGKAWYKKKTPNNNFLAISYGAGLRFNLGQYSSAKIIIAQPTTGKMFFDEYKKMKRPTKILLGLYFRA